MEISEFTYADYLDLDRAFIAKNKFRIKEMIGDEDALTVLAELDLKFEGSGGSEDVCPMRLPTK